MTHTVIQLNASIKPAIKDACELKDTAEQSRVLKYDTAASAPAGMEDMAQDIRGHPDFGILFFRVTICLSSASATAFAYFEIFPEWPQCSCWHSQSLGTEVLV